MLLEVALIIFTIIFIIYQAVVWNNDYWKKRGIPYEEPEFFFGNFREIIQGKEPYGVIFTRMYKKFSNSPFVGLFNLRDPVLLVRDLDAVKQVLATNFASFTDTDFTVDLRKDIIWALNPFSNKGDGWKAVRSRWAPHFSPAKIKLSYESLTKTSDKLIEHIKGLLKNEPKKPIRLREMASTFFLDYIVYGIFGVQNNSFTNPNNVFMEIRQTLFSSTYIEGLLIASFAIFPSLAKVFSVRFVSKNMEDKLLKVSKNIIKSRNETGQPNADIYDTLQKFSQNDGKKTFSELDVAAKMFGTILDGSETTSNPSSLGIYEIACNPDVQEKLRNELDDAYEQSEDGKLSYEELHRLPYLDMVFSEILRMYVPVFQFPRVCTKDIVLEGKGQKVAVTKGMRVMIPVYGIHHDPKYYPNPFKFDPERFSPEAKEQIPKFAYMPFGEGPRMCVGMRLGIMEAKLLIATIVRNYELKPGVTLPRPIEYDPNVFVPRSLVDVSVYLTPRNIA